MDLNQISGYVLIGLGIASALVPAARQIAKLTATKTDDDIIEKVALVIHNLLTLVPTLSFGRPLDTSDVQNENQKQHAAVAAAQAKAPKAGKIENL